ncbi:MAG: TonB-dependent receptor [Rhizobacter sp.]|nr:TonB-dependent receptor [Burkholderiales bacterium]
MQYLLSSRASIPVSFSSKLLVTAIAATGCAFSATTIAQTTSATATAKVDTVIVTATRTPTRVDQALGDVTVIDRGQIEQSAGKTLAELLGQQAGVQFWANGGQGKPSSVSLRGLEARHTLLLIDGVRYSSATLGTPTWENIPLESIERIEIVRGPLSGLYGSDAVGGVIQIFTRRGKDGLRGNAVATIGSKHYGQLGAGLSFGQGAFDGSVQVQRTENRGFSATNSRVPFDLYNPDNDGFRQNSGNAQLGWKIGGGWRADARILQSDGVTQYDDGLGADAKAKLRSQVASVNVGGPVTALWQTNVRVARSTDDYVTLASASPYSDLGKIATVQDQLAWENTIATPVGAAVVILEQTKQKVSRPGEPFTLSDRNIMGIAAGLNGGFGAHHWQANLRHDKNSQFGSQTTGTAAYGFDLTSAWRIGAAYGTSFVTPTFNQLYYPGYSNPKLLPEEGKQSEVNVRWLGNNQQARLTYFDSRIRGYISSGPLPTNIPRTRIDGVTASYEARIANVTLAASVDHVNPRNDSSGSSSYGKLLPRRVKDSAKLSADVDLGAWRLGGSLVAFGERFEDAANSTRLPGFATLDLRADWRLAKEWSVAFRVNNVTGKKYETVYGYNQPGREGYLTLRYSGF